jgi:hypothetical protein
MSKILILLLLTLLMSCGDCKRTTEAITPIYTVLNEDKLSIPGKSQTSIYVLYNDTVYTESKLKEVALEVLFNSQKEVLKDKDPAKIFMIYIYSKKETYAADKSKWISMLYKGMNSSQPEIAYTLLESAKIVIPDDIEFENIPVSSYEVVTEKVSETPSKAQIVQYIWYKGVDYTETALRATAMNVYNLKKDMGGFKMHDNPTVVALYLFTSKEAMEDKSEWIAMLMKGPSNTEPSISFNSFKVTALNNIEDNVRSTDEIDLDKLNAYLGRRGLNLCSLAKSLKKMELDNIHKADARYPDYGDKHMAMIDALDDQFYRSLRAKHNLSEEMLGKVSIFAMAYCK